MMLMPTWAMNTKKNCMKLKELSVLRKNKVIKTYLHVHTKYITTICLICCMLYLCDEGTAAHRLIHIRSFQTLHHEDYFTQALSFIVALQAATQESTHWSFPGLFTASHDETIRSHAFITVVSLLPHLPFCSDNNTATDGLVGRVWKLRCPSVNG